MALPILSTATRAQRRKALAAWDYAAKLWNAHVKTVNVRPGGVSPAIQSLALANVPEHAYYVAVCNLPQNLQTPFKVANGG